MSTDQNTNASVNAPVLCKMGCGFFGSEATGSCCSKCWMESMKQKAAAQAPAPTTTTTQEEPANEPLPADSMDVEPIVTKTPAAPVPLSRPASPRSSPSSPSSAPKAIKKKKKKASYKSMMSTMMKSSSPKDVRKEREALSKGLGGGAFSKIDKI